MKKILRVIFVLCMLWSVVSDVDQALAIKAPADEGMTELVSVSSDGTQGNSASDDPSISEDGRYVAFYSGADNLVIGDTNGYSDIFVRDRVSGRTERISTASDGIQGNKPSYSPSISANGRYVAFESAATNLVYGDTNNVIDIFVRDLLNDTTERISVASDGTQGDDFSNNPSISSDGRYVAFASWASNLTQRDRNYREDVFVKDRLSMVTELISTATDGTQANSASFLPSISANGRYVAFETGANNLVDADTNGVMDVYVKDRFTGTTEWISVGSDGAQPNNNSGVPSISANGEYVVFVSYASNLIAADRNNHQDVFVRDRVFETTEIISTASDGILGNDDSGNSSISSDGRYVLFASWASNLTNWIMNSYGNVFLKDQVSGEMELISVASDGSHGNGVFDAISISADGMSVAFSSGASNLVDRDTNQTTDVFVRDWNGNNPSSMTQIFLPMIVR